MVDLPVPDNNTIIIFSATGGGSNEGGKIRQNISFSSITDLTLSGGISNNYVRVTPSGSSFEVVAKYHKAQYTGTFSVTATTAGDEENNLEAASVSFTFRVLVIGTDLPHLTQSFFEFAVGETVDTALNVFYAAPNVLLNISKVSTAITSLTDGKLTTETDADRGNISYSVWEGTPSGIVLTPELDENNNVIGASLTGTAVRPGIYYVNFVISSYDNSGSSDPFPGANGAGLVIINIYDDRESPKIAVPVTYAIDPDYIRVIRHELRSNYTAERLTGDFTRSEEVWTREVSEAISTSVSEVWEYRIEYDEENELWRLSGRYYLSDEDAPEFSVLATASGRFGEVPPNTGWTGGIRMAGDGVKFVAGYGFFDWKGTRDIEIATDDDDAEEEAETFSGPVYEQQPIVSAQYDGWSNPAELQYDSGLYLAPDPAGNWRISTDPEATDGTIVEPTGIEKAVIPYLPPTAAAVNGTAFRDVSIADAAVPINAHLETDELALRHGSGIAAVKPHYTFLRQAVPQVNAGPTCTVAFSVVQTEDGESWDNYANSAISSDADSEGKYSVSRSFSVDHNLPATQTTFSGSIPLNAWTRTDAELIAGVFGAYGTDLPCTFDYTYDSASRYYYGTEEIANDGTSQTQTTEDVQSTIKRVNEISSKYGWGLGVFGSGREADDSRVRCVSAGAGGAGLSCDVLQTFNRTEVKTDWNGSTTQTWGPETSIIGSEGATITAITPMFTYTSPGSLDFDGITAETVTASFTGSYSRTLRKTRDADGKLAAIYLENTSHSVKVEHYHKSYSGALPPGLVSYGWTKVQKTEDGETTTTYYSDPYGSIFESNRGNYGIADPQGEPEEVSSSANYAYTYESKRDEYRSTLTEKLG